MLFFLRLLVLLSWLLAEQLLCTSYRRGEPDSPLPLLKPSCVASKPPSFSTLWVSCSSSFPSTDHCLCGDEVPAPSADVPLAVHEALNSDALRVPKPEPGPDTCLTHRLACLRMLFEGSVLMLVLGLLVLIGWTFLWSRL